MNRLIQNIVAESQLSTQEAWWLLQSITQKSKEQLIISNENLTHKEQSRLSEAIYKIKHDAIPLAYLIGNVPFGALTINVKPPILIPRPETEEWVYRLIEQLTPYRHSIKTILDIGTGSGCIALALAHAFPQAKVLATDINQEALKLAQENAEKNNIKNVIFVESDLFKNLKNNTFDLVVSNPPYIAPSFKNTLNPSVINWEDHGALFAENNGLRIINEIISALPTVLSPENLPTKFVIECDPEQTSLIIDFCTTKNFSALACTDSFGNQRSVWGQLKT